MISSSVLTALGIAATALSLAEIASVFVQSGNVAWSLVRRISGRSTAPMSQMQTAMFWVQAIGLLVVGCILISVGLSVWEI
jgi:hypothetical protein